MTQGKKISVAIPWFLLGIVSLCLFAVNGLASFDVDSDSGDVSVWESSEESYEEASSGWWGSDSSDESDSDSEDSWFFDSGSDSSDSWDSGSDDDSWSDDSWDSGSDSGGWDSDSGSDSGSW